MTHMNVHITLRKKHEQNSEDFVIFDTVLLQRNLQLKYKLKPEYLTRIKIYTYL